MSGRRYVMTARRKAALRKAQLVSARKRRGKKMSTGTKRKLKKAALITGGTVLAGTAAYGGMVGGKAVRTRKSRHIDKMVVNDWGPGGAKRKAADAAFGREVANLNRNRPATRGSGTVDRRRAPMRPYIPSAPYPENIDRAAFIRAMWVEKISKKGNRWRSAHTQDEQRRRRRNANPNHPSNDLATKNISPWEAWQRTLAYQRAMSAKGIKINLSHIEIIYGEYQKQRGDEF